MTCAKSICNKQSNATKIASFPFFSMKSWYQYETLHYKDNITTSIEHKQKNTGINSFTKYWKAASLKPSFRLSVEIWSRFSKLVCFNWVHNFKFLPASF